MSQPITTPNNVELWYESFGDLSNSPILLAAGNTCPALMWPDEFCQSLASLGHYVIRFDQRDTGLSTYFDYEANPYDLNDMAEDIIGLLDCLKLENVNFVGLSQGGMLGQMIALDHPERLRTLTTIMSSPDMSPKNDAFAGKAPNPSSLPPPTDEFVQGVIAINKEPATNDAGAISQLIENFRLAKGPRSPFDDDFWQALMTDFVNLPKTRSDQKQAKVANHGNHSRAQAATPPLSPESLRKIAVPTLVIHGSDDPIFPPAHSEALVESIPESRLLIVDKMGHAFDPAFFDEIARAIKSHIV